MASRGSRKQRTRVFKRGTTRGFGVSVNFELLDEGFFAAAEDIGISIQATKQYIRELRDLYIDRQIDYYAREVETSPFKPGSIGRFSPGRGRAIREGDRFARASGDLLSQLLDAKLVGINETARLDEKPNPTTGRFSFSSTADFGFLIEARGEKAITQERIQRTRFGRSLVGKTTLNIDEIEEGWWQAFQEAYVTLTGLRSSKFTTDDQEFADKVGITRGQQRQATKVRQGRQRNGIFSPSSG